MSIKPTRRDLLRTAGALAALGPLARLTRPAAAQARRPPNILFFFPDQHRWDWRPSHREVPVPMPNLAALEQRGTAVDRAFCAAPVCGPSRACLATGREYDACGVPTMRVDFPRDRTTVYRRLRDHGYHVLGCGKMDLASKTMHDAIDSKGGEPVTLGADGRRFHAEWGFSDAINNAGKGAGALMYLADPVGAKDSYYTYLDGQTPKLGRLNADDMERRRTPKRLAQWGDTRPSLLDDQYYSDNWIGRNGLELIGAVPQGEPWFIQINFNSPHPPFDMPKSYERLYRGPDRVIDNFEQPHGYHGPWDAARQIAIRQNYAAMLENIDRWLGIYLQAVAARGELDNTYVLWSSDHGEMLGDLGRWGKQVPFEPSVGVPLVMAGPGIRAGHRSDALVSLIDLSATFLDWAGAPADPEMDGFSLRPLLEGRTDSHREYMLSGLYDWRLVCDGRYKLITNFEGAAVQLFDLHEDPYETTDIAARDPQRVAALQALMRQGSYRPATASA